MSIMGLPPGLRGYAAQRNLQSQEQNQQLGQMQGLLGIQQAMTQRDQMAKDQEFKGLLGARLAAGDMEGAKTIAMQYKPELFAQSLVPKAPNWRESRVKQPDGTVKVGYVDMNSPTPESTFRQMGNEPVRNEFVNGAPVNPYQPPSTPIPSPTNPFNLAPDGKGGFGLVPNQPVQDFQLRKAATGAARNITNVNSLQETEENKTIGKELGQQYAGIQNAGMQAPSRISKLQRMAQLSDGVTTGALTPAMTDIAALADSLGVKVDKNLGAKQAFEALSNEVALSLRSTADGGGMPGAMSDKDREFLKAMTPSLSKTPEGNRLIIESGIKLEQRKQQVASMARDYRAKNRTLEGFSDALQKWSDANPIFSAPEAKRPGVKFLGFE